MNAKISNAIAWPYFHPLFSEATIEANGTLGLAQSGANLVVWAALIGVGSHFAGFKHPYRIAIGALVVFVAAEVLFGASGPSTNGSHIQSISQNNTAPSVNAPALSPNGVAITVGTGTGFGDGEENFGSVGNGYNS